MKIPGTTFALVREVFKKSRANFAEVSKRGWRTEGVGCEEILPTPEIEAPFLHFFSYAPV